MERSADWMIQAEGDLLHARNDVAGGYYEWACFSAQHAAEKAVNAVFHTLTLTPPARRGLGIRTARP